MVVVIYGGLATLLLLRTGQSSFHMLMELLQREASDNTLRLIVGWSIATFAPLLLSVCILIFQRRLKARWLVHILFVPCALALYRVGGTILDPSAMGEDIIAEYALILATSLFLLTLIVHLAGFVHACIARKPPAAHGS